MCDIVWIDAIEKFEFSCPKYLVRSKPDSTIHFFRQGISQRGSSRWEFHISKGNTSFDAIIHILEILWYLREFTVFARRWGTFCLSSLLYHLIFLFLCLLYYDILLVDSVYNLFSRLINYPFLFLYQLRSYLLLRSCFLN